MLDGDEEGEGECADDQNPVSVTFSSVVKTIVSIKSKTHGLGTISSTIQFKQHKVYDVLDGEDV